MPSNDSHAEDCTGSRQIYVASSWRNQLQETVVHLLRSRGHYVYDFKHPDDTVDRGFHWGDAGLDHSNPVDGDPRAVDLAAAGDFVAALSDRAAIQAFRRDFDAMLAASCWCCRADVRRISNSAGPSGPASAPRSYWMIRALRNSCTGWWTGSPPGLRISSTGSLRAVRTRCGREA